MVALPLYRYLLVSMYLCIYVFIYYLSSIYLLAAYLLYLSIIYHHLLIISLSLIIHLSSIISLLSVYLSLSSTGLITLLTPAAFSYLSLYCFFCPERSLHPPLSAFHIFHKLRPSARPICPLWPAGPEQSGSDGDLSWSHHGSLCLAYSYQPPLEATLRQGPGPFSGTRRPERGEPSALVGAA